MNMSASIEEKADVVVIGAGIVGLACAWAALRDGARVTIVDRDFEGDRASHGNAGGIAVTESMPLAVHGMFTKAAKWLMDPLGPLALDWKHVPKALPWFMAFRRASEPERYQAISHALALLNNRVYDDLLPMFADIGASSMHYREGALTVYETDEAFAADQAEWMLKRELGVRWHAMNAQQVRECEPALASVFKHGVYLDDWSQVGDPRRIVTLLRERVRALGARFVTGVARAIEAPDAVVLADGMRVVGRRIVVATGAWSAALAQSIGDRVLLESERGYNTTLPKHGIKLTREVIFAERKFVASPLDVGLRIGGAAEFAGLDAPPNYRRSDALLALGKRFIPGIDDTDARKWMGHRPATPDSLPVIGASPRVPSVIYAFGHGHLGLTQSATTAALVADVLAGRMPRVPITPYSIARF
ncbi:NAD(P)/FAD-dependent oxidoreductase [Caballeronia insecticola]|uniref:D-amino-acid dehydrogenase n=1 Tax=Caballeronia insecticola TaxID=758793 RepID=R4WZA7_9BURK|nr:FAD-dependent oxidoreductase [Caballeronia insecticola]BAN27040.1 D-amino-acid dehydrogenase [Caballeronia insecticola]